MKNPIHKHILPIALAMLLPAGLSAQNAFTLGFDTGTEGFTGTNVTGLAATGGFISGTASSGDPRIVKATATSTSTPIFSKPAAASWQTVKFRVRETADPLTPGTPVTTFDATGLAVVLSSANSTSGSVTISSSTSTNASFSASALDVDNFFTVTVNISTFTANEIRYLRVDPIGGSDAASNKFEVDYIEITRSNTPPALVSTTPADGATGVSPTGNLVATFDEPVFLNTTGSVTIKNLTNPSPDIVISIPGPDSDGTLSVSGNQLTIDPAADLLPSSEYAIEISVDAIKDDAGGFYAGILSTDNPNWSFTTIMPPVLLSTSPVDNATAVSPSANLIAAFDKTPISLNTTGSITIKDLTTATDTVISLSGSDPDGTLSVFLNQLLINPTAELLPGHEYAIEISPDAIKDANNLFYPGILATDVPNWSFTTDNLPPAPAFFHPASGSDEAPLNGALFIAFDENVLKGTGNLAVYRADNTPVETIAVTSPNVTISGSVVTITPTVALAHGTSYYVLIDNGAFTNISGSQAYAGIGSPAGWTFTTVANDPKILFGDSFNRPDSTDLNASAIGKYGSLGALSHTSRIIGSGNVQLSAGQLLAQAVLPTGTFGGLVYINHNFTEASITSGGGFSITVDLNTYSTAGSGRYMIVGVGQSSSELDGQTTASLGTATVADLAVGFRGTTSTLEIRKNGGSPIVTSSLPSAPAKMRIDYDFSDFNAGSTVNYSVFFNDDPTAFTSGTFTWSGANENYISLSSNLYQEDLALETRNSLFDNLQIRLKQAPVTDNYESWATANSVAGGENGDSDDDGVKNLVEYALANGGERGVLSGNTITFTKRGSPYGNDLTYIIETSETLTGSWMEEVTHGPAQLGSPIGYDLTPVPGKPRKFARLKVVRVP